MLAFDGTGVEGLRASGRAEVNAEQVVIPVNARAARITGLNAAAGGILRNVRVSGDFAYAAGRLISDNLKIDSDRMNATAVPPCHALRAPAGHFGWSAPTHPASLCRPVHSAR